MAQHQPGVLMSELSHNSNSSELKIVLTGCNILLSHAMFTDPVIGGELVAIEEQSPRNVK